MNKKIATHHRPSLYLVRAFRRGNQSSELLGSPAALRPESFHHRPERFEVYNLITINADLSDIVRADKVWREKIDTTLSKIGGRIQHSNLDLHNGYVVLRCALRWDEITKLKTSEPKIL